MIDIFMQPTTQSRSTNRPLQSVPQRGYSNVYDDDDMTGSHAAKMECEDQEHAEDDGVLQFAHAQAVNC